MVIDCFAGAGGASTGLSQALGRDPDVAINHDDIALRTHAANHPKTLHLCGDIWDAKPRDLARGRDVDLVWLSPSCTHFSRARGGKPSSPQLRALPWVGVRFAREVKPRLLVCENVVEMKSWGRLNPDGSAHPRFIGHTYATWLGKLRAAGYQVDTRTLRSCDYGAPTTRERLFIVARRDGAPEWPRPTHGPGLKPFRSAGECIDWSIPARSIFDREKPLAEPTLRRIARALHVHVLGGNPYLVPDIGAAAALIQTGYGEREGQLPRALDIRQPLGTVVAGGVKHAVVVAVLVKHYGGNYSGSGVSLREPMSTITTQDHHALVTAVATRNVDQRRREQVRALLELGDGSAQLTLGGGHAGVLRINGEAYEIGDVQMRMLRARELSNAQGFPPDYILDVGGIGESKQIHMVGNSVSPHVARAIVAANAGSVRASEAA